jgi:PAS domain S-box-containing protein
MAVSLGVFLLETTIMWFLEPLWSYNERLESLIDATTLLLAMAPLLYFLFVRPMARIIREKTAAEQALRLANESLESKVQTRTAELEATNASLQLEARQRLRAIARLQVQGKLLDAVQQAVIATDIEGHVTYWNQFAEEMFRWRLEEVRAHLLGDLALFVPLGEAPSFSATPAFRGWDGEVKALRREGEGFPAYLTCSPMWKPDGTIGGLVYTFIDITDRKEAEEAVRLSEERYSVVVENSPTGICILQAAQVVFANRRLFELLALDSEDPGAVVPAQFIHPEDWPTVQAFWRQRLEGSPASRDYEFRVLTHGGNLRWFLGRSTLIHVQGHKALLVNVQDVTERHETLQALRDSQELLQQLSASQIAAQEHERKRVAQELHDSLGQSLSAIKFILERTLETAPGQEARASQATIRSVVPLIQSTMEEVRRISMALRPSTLDDLGLLMTISWFIREFQLAYPEIQVEKDFQVEEEQIPETLKTNIFRILQEALNNAAKHSRAQRVVISLRWLQDRLELKIQDHGIGFDPRRRKKASVSGGLGLDSMRERAILFGGLCTIDSAPGAGTTVTARWTLEPGPEVAIPVS